MVMAAEASSIVLNFLAFFANFLSIKLDEYTYGKADNVKGTNLAMMLKQNKSV